MIKKINSIQQIGVFDNYNWDNSCRKADGNIQEFTRVNVLFGRNYSGKTTLSRIVRAFETKTLPENYENPTFSIALDDNTLVTNNDLDTDKINIRVFNEDFVRDNLGFVIDPEAKIISFAVLGEKNKELDVKIQKIKKELGKDSLGSETGLYKDLTLANTNSDSDSKAYSKELNELEKKKKNEAHEIKYDTQKYNNVNYTIRNLERDLITVSSSSYFPPTKEELKSYSENLDEKSLPPPKAICPIPLSIKELSAKVEEICNIGVGQSKKIQELATNLALENWVHSGLTENKDRKTCAFCGNPITDSRWKELYNHFDEESEKLRNDIELTLQRVEAERTKVLNSFNPNEKEFYLEYQPEIINLHQAYDQFAQKYITALIDLKKLLIKRKESLYAPISFIYEHIIALDDYTNILASYTSLRNDSIAYSDNLSEKIAKAQDQLRLAEVARFVKDTDYTAKLKELSKLEEKKIESAKNVQYIKDTIQNKIEELETLKRQQNDEEKGARQVNKYLQQYFGHNYLSMTSKNDGGGCFEIERNGAKAYNLSEGEKNLISFCYFMAKLEEPNTVNASPIIWIDDPISSLDENHIFYLYSLIVQEILEKDKYEQLFISTHSIIFLKYLRRLNIKDAKRKKRHFSIERKGSTSVIIPMPSYLEKHGTEFNKWFENIYRCANEVRTDKNDYLFETYGNNARKFLETYLYYRYPDDKSDDEHYRSFFGDDNYAMITAKKMHNELSHAEGDLENHTQTFDVPEIQRAAKFIIDKLQEIDNDQYKALVSSIQTRN